jgi:serine/threonine protein kinase
VYAVEFEGSCRCAALKIPKGVFNEEQVRKEVMIWRQIGKHDHVVNFIDDFALDDKHVILMEKCECSLKCRIGVSIVSEDNTACMLRQMTSSLAHLESLAIAHRDIKPDNFLCTIGDANEEILKLCDLGFAEFLPATGQLFGKFGTPSFMSPEMVGDGAHNLKTDVWSLGATCYLMLYGACPYTVYPPTAKNVMRAIARGFPVPTYQGVGYVSHAAKESVTRLLHRSMDTRISAIETLRLPFLNATAKQFSMKASTIINESVVGIESQSTHDEATESMTQTSFSASVDGNTRNLSGSRAYEQTRISL